MSQKLCEGKIFRGEYSHKMWKVVNDADTVKKLASALYFVCCQIQELEEKLEHRYHHEEEKKGCEACNPGASLRIELRGSFSWSNLDPKFCPNCGRKL